MDTPQNYTVTRGLPFNPGRIRVVGGASMWTALDQFEVQSQLRTQAAPPSQLIVDLAQFMTPSLDGADIVIDWVMTGAQTRQITKAGYYDLILSDVGPTDAKALPILRGRIEIKDTTTDTAAVAP